MTVWEDVSTGTLSLLDGRNRLRALIASGRELHDYYFHVVGHCESTRDPYAYVISANIHRRHLSAEQKRDLIAKVVKATPEKSNRQIAEVLKVDHKTVASVRAVKVATGEIPQLTKTLGKDGKKRKQPKLKPKPPTTAIKPKDPAIAAAADRAVARSEVSQKNQALISGTADAACASAKEPKTIIVLERYLDFAMMIEEEAERLAGDRRTEFLLYLRKEIERLLRDTNVVSTIASAAIARTQRSQ